MDSKTGNRIARVYIESYVIRIKMIKFEIPVKIFIGQKSMKIFGSLTIILLFLSATIRSQNPNIKSRLDMGELKMNFPGIYFRHNATAYAEMPYTADSSFKYIALHIKDINDLVIWRDSLETEKLTKQRIKKLKAGLSKYKVTGIYIESMGKEQKISRRIIYSVTDSTQIQYLLSLNSVFDISGTRFPDKTALKAQNVRRLPCWMNLRLNKAGREHCKMERRMINKSKGK